MAATVLSNADDARDAALEAGLRRLFPPRLYAAAQRLIDSGDVDARTLQAGRVITGLAGTGGSRHRVYIQCGRTAQLSIDGECSCGEPDPCVHVVAVAIAAALRPSAPAVERLRKVDVATAPPLDSPENAATRQWLCYVLNAGRLSIWVVMGPTADARACPLEIRRSDGRDEYPRYVDGQDREILKAPGAQNGDGAGCLAGAAGYRLLRQTVATGRAVWRSLDGIRLRDGASRAADFAWEALPDGDQWLRCRTPATLDFMLDVEPAVYVDTASGETGPLDLPYPVELLRQCLNRPPVAPEDVAALNEQATRTAHADAFPRPRTFTVHRQAACDVRGGLVLAAGPQATLHFVYDGTAVERGSLRDDQVTVRALRGDSIHEIERDRTGELRLTEQLSEHLPQAPGDRAAWLRMMAKSVPVLRAAGWDVRVEEDFPYRIAAVGEWYTQVRPQNREWFDLQFGVMVDGHEVNLLPALVHYLKEPSALDAESWHLAGDQLLVRLDDGKYLPVPIDRLQRIADTLVELYDDRLTQAHSLTLPMSQVSRLTQLAVETSGSALRSEDPALRALAHALDGCGRIAPQSAPPAFRAHLRPYQEQGVGWLQFLRSAGVGGILADDMGLGKTVQTLAHLALEKDHGRLTLPSLIVAPVSVIGNWQNELRQLAPGLRSLTLHGAKRRELFEQMHGADVVIIGYPFLLTDGDMLMAREFYYVILDEAQMIKNPRAKVAQVARALRAHHRLCLTGTPMENHLGELWSLFQFVQPGLLGAEREFQRHYRTPIERNGDGRRARALSTRLRPFLLRRTKDAVAPELPPKMEMTESIALDELQRDFYDAIRLRMHRRVREIIESQGLARSHITVLDALLKLRQACCDPRLVSNDAETRRIPSAKLEWLSTALPQLIAEGRRILVFSQFTTMLRLIEAVAAQLGIPFCLLTGATSDRTAVVARFQSGAAPLFLISLKAGGTGLNLTAADTVIHYDPWWNPAVEAQATDRAHRIGQDKPVFVYKLIARRTVEEKILELQADKHALVNRIHADQTAAPSSWSREDLELLFAP